MDTRAISRKDSKLERTASSTGIEEIEFEAHGQAEDFYIDPQAEKRLLRKLDLRLIPWLCLLYLISFLDRTNIGNAKIQGPGSWPNWMNNFYSDFTLGLGKDLKITPNQFNMTLTIFFITYSIFGELGPISI
jgi:hypothetical protein